VSLAGGSHSSPADIRSQTRCPLRSLQLGSGVHRSVSTCSHPGSFQPDREAFAAYVQRLRPEAEVYQLELNPTPHTDDDRWHDKLLFHVRQLLLLAFAPLRRHSRHIADCRNCRSTEGAIALSSSTAIASMFESNM
jgi:hypothetical protein